MEAHFIKWPSIIKNVSLMRPLESKNENSKLLMMRFAYKRSAIMRNYLNRFPRLPPNLDKELPMPSSVTLGSFGSFALLANFCKIPGRIPAMAPPIAGDKPNLLVKVPTSPPSIPLASGLPDVIPF